MWFLLTTCLFCFLPPASPTCHTSENDCIVAFGNWSDCDPCTRIRSRHVNITTPPHFDGLPCPDSLVEHEPCFPKGDCPADLPCPGQFDCKFEGRCVNDTLVCNGDDDCGNNADERECPKESFSRAMQECLSLETIPYLDQIGSGVDLTTGKLAGRVVDNQRFKGLCRKAFNGDQQKVYRMPYNVDNFHFRVATSDELQSQSYHSLADYTNTLDKSDSLDWHESLEGHAGWSLWKVSVSQSMSYSSTDTFKSIYSSMKDGKSMMFKVGAKLEVAEFIMKGDNFLLDVFFEQSIHKLPTSLNSKVYFDFFKQYGSFFLHGGVLGGTYEHSYIFSSDDLKSSKQSEKTLKNCLKFSLSASLGYGGVGEAKAEGGFNKCKDEHGEEKSSVDVSRSATHKVVSIKGGTTVAAGKLAGAAMEANANFTRSKFEEWTLGVQQNPILLKKTVRPICDLFMSSRSPKKELKRDACLHALAAYLQPYNANACTGCKNGGKPLKLDGQCQCACPIGFKGQACAEHEHELSSLPLLSAAGPIGGSIASKGDIKILTKGDPPIAENPPYMHKLAVGPFDNILKTKEDKVYILSTISGGFVNNYGNYTGGYSIKMFSEYLATIETIPVDLASIPDCGDPKQFSICHIRDYDIDMHGYFIISVQISNKLGTGWSSIFKINSRGKSILKIHKPCETEKIKKVSLYVSTTCHDQIVVTCPSLTPATVKIFSSSGEPQGLTQFDNFGLITSVQYFKRAIWIHTLDNKVAAYDMFTWEQIFNFTGDSKLDPGEVTPYSQVFVDFAGNLIVAQTHDLASEDGTPNFKFNIVDTGSRKVLAYARLESWNNCLDVATYRGKLYLLCYEAKDATKRAVLVFDYLK